MDARLQQNPFPVFSWPKKLLDHKETASKTMSSKEWVLCFFLIYPAAVCMTLSSKGNHGLLFVLITDHVYVNHCLNCLSKGANFIDST